jgi:hypothetical protein
VPIIKIPQFGSEIAISLFLSGRRNLTLEQVRRLSDRFKLPVDLFVSKALGAKAYLPAILGRRKSFKDFDFPALESFKELGIEIGKAGDEWKGLKIKLAKLGHSK